MSKRILIFGGSGFIGLPLTKFLLQEENQICVICNDEEKALNKIGQHQNLEIKIIDIFDESKIKKLIKDHDVIINLIGKLFETKKGDFKKFHQKFPNILAKNLSDKQYLVHISALGIEDSTKTSLYAETKLAGQNEITKICKNYNIIKPSIVFGDQDNFFNLFAKMAKISPFLPLI